MFSHLHSGATLEAYFGYCGCFAIYPSHSVYDEDAKARIIVCRYVNTGRHDTVIGDFCLTITHFTIRVLIEVVGCVISCT